MQSTTFSLVGSGGMVVGMGLGDFLVRCGLEMAVWGLAFQWGALGQWDVAWEQWTYCFSVVLKLTESQVMKGAVGRLFLGDALVLVCCSRAFG